MHDAKTHEIMPDLASQGIDGGMLVLSRKVDERIIIGESIVVTVIELRGDRVRLGIQAHDTINIRERKIAGRGTVGKAIIQGLLERGGEARMSVIPRTDDQTLMGTVRRNVEKGAILNTDALPAYGALCFDYIHKFVDHLTQYVKDGVHTNGLENFFSLLKRTLAGTYVSVAPFHLERYTDEQTYRFNNRGGNDRSRFLGVLSTVVGRRLTWKVLTAQGDAGFMGIQ